MRGVLGVLLLALASLGLCQREFSRTAFPSDGSPENSVIYGPKPMANGNIVFATTTRYEVTFANFDEGFEVRVFLTDGSLKWSYSRGATDSTNAYLEGIETDPYGNVYIIYSQEFNGRNLAKLAVADGTEVWTRGISENGPMKGLADGSLVIAGSQYYGSNDVTRYDSSGNVADGGTFTGVNPQELVTDASGNVYVASSDPTDGWNLSKLDSNLNSSWHNWYDDSPNGQVPATPERIFMTASYLYIGASKSYNSYDDDMVVYQINPANGNENWSARYNGSMNGRDVLVETATGPDGSVAAIGKTALSSGSVGLMAVFDSNGAYKFAAEMYSYIGGNCEPKSATFDSSGNLYVAGYIDRGSSRGDAFLRKFSPTGASLWTYYYDNDTHGKDDGRHVRIGPNGDIEFYLAERTGISYNGLVLKMKQVSASLSATSVTGGNPVNLTVSFNSSQGLDAQLTTSANSSTVSVPNPVTIAAYTLSKTVAVTTTPVLVDAPCQIYVWNGAQWITLNLLVKAPILNTMTLSASTVQGGTNVTATIGMTGKAPSGGLTVNLFEATVYADINPTLFFLAGEQTKTVTVVTKPVLADQVVTIIASYNGSSRNRTLTITRPLLNALTVPTGTYTGGATIPLTVWLTGNAPAGLVVTLSDDSSAATTPASVAFSQNASSSVASIPTTPVTANTLITFTATLNGVTKTKLVTLVPPTLASLTVTPTIVFGGYTTTGIVMLNQPAPAGGVTVSLSSNLPALVTLPPSVSIPAGAASMSFMIRTGSVASQTSGKIFATFSSKTVSGDIVLLP